MNEQNKRTWLIVGIIISLIPPVLLVQFPSLVSLKTVMLYASALVGYWGVIFLLWQYALGARSIVSLAFKDLAPVLSIHKWLGKYGGLVIFLHPFLVLYFYSESLLYPFLLNINNEFERAVTLGRIAFLIMLGIWFTSAIVRDRIKFRPWKYIHYFAYICLPFVLLHIPNVGSQYMSHAAVKTYYFSLVVVFLIVTLARIRGWLNLDTSEYVIVGHGKLTDTDYLVTLKPTDGPIIRPQQGQFVYLRLGLISESHPFSVFSYNAESNELSVAYRTFGAYTDVLSKQLPGTKISVSGPYGTFMQAMTPTEPVVYISGGIGITPFVEKLRQDVGKRDQWLFAANRSPESAVTIPWVKSFLGERCVSVYSQTETARLSPDEKSGHITPDLLREQLNDPQRYQYYVCGPSGMMKTMRAMLVDMGIDTRRIHSETFGW